jgi:c-di-GMP-binding flagellar brake protein YcgR
LIEKRKFVRLKAPIGIAYSPVHKGKRCRTHLTFIKNLSGTGLSLLVKEDLRVGDLLKLAIQIPHLEESIDGIGEVVWVNIPEAGVRFRDISPSDLNKIMEYVYTIGIG